MKIKTIELENFRSIQKGTINFDKLTAIIGRNGTGKSSYLYAIDFFYNLAVSVNSDDFFNRNSNSPINIRITFFDLIPEEVSEFSSYMKDGNFTVTKIFDGEGKTGKYFAAIPQIPRFSEIRSIPGKNDKKSAWNDLVESGLYPGISRVRGADEIDPMMEIFENAHPELTQMIEKQVQFGGAPNIGGGKLDNHTKYVLIPAVRKVTDEFSGKKGAIDQLLELIVLRKIRSRKDLQDFREEFETRAKSLFCAANLPELPELGNSLSKTLHTYAPGCQIKLKWDENITLPEIQPPSSKATLIEDNFEGRIENKGHGLQRALILTLLQYLASIPSEKKLVEEKTEIGDQKNEGSKISDNAQQDASPTQTKEEVKEKELGPDLILGIEEPELYLHPTRARHLASVFGTLVNSGNGKDSPRTQIIFATHSPFFVNISDFNQIRILRKVPSDAPNPMQSQVFTFSLDEAIAEWSKISKEDPSNLKERGFIARTIPIMTTLVNEGFFADTIVIVEGLSDLGILWTLQEIMGKKWSEKGIAILPVSGKANLDRPAIIFRGFQIPMFLLFDGDIKHKGKKEDERKNAELNKKLLRFSDTEETDFPKTQVHDTWAVIEDDIEKLMKDTLGEPIFSDIRSKVATEMGIDSNRVIKNVEGSSLFIKKVYDGGNRIPFLEKVIENVSSLK